METGEPFPVSSAGAGLVKPPKLARVVISTKGVREAMVEVRLLVVRAAQMDAEEMAATRTVQEIAVDLCAYPRCACSSTLFKLFKQSSPRDSQFLRGERKELRNAYSTSGRTQR